MPVSEPAGSGGVSIVAVPIFDFAGQETALRVPLPSWASSQKTRPSAADGLSPMPSGSERLRRLHVRVGDRGAGVEGDGDLDLGAAGRVGLVGAGGGRDPRFERDRVAAVGLTPGGSAPSKGVEPLGKLGFGLSIESARRKVE